MATITEDYVSFETAKLLKEKGFDEYCPLWYNLDKPEEGPFFYKEIGWYGHNSYDYNGKRIVSAPTLQKAMKWLREEFDLITYVRLVNDGDLCHDAWGFSIYNKFTNESIKDNRLWFKYEEACEASIKYCLENLI